MVAGQRPRPAAVQPVWGLLRNPVGTPENRHFMRQFMRQLMPPTPHQIAPGRDAEAGPMGGTLRPAYRASLHQRKTPPKRGLCECNWVTRLINQP